MLGFLSIVLAKKLNFLKSKLKEWNRDVFGLLDTKMPLLKRLRCWMPRSNFSSFLGLRDWRG